MSRVYYIRHDKSAAIELDGPDHERVVIRVDPDPPYDHIELLGRVIARGVAGLRSSWRWDYQRIGGEIVRLEAADARSAGWALERAVMTERAAASRAAA